MCDFKPGDQVVCIIAQDMPWGDGEPVMGIVEGAVYTVSEIALRPDDDLVCVTLLETGNFDASGFDWGYYPWRFRKVQRKTTDLSVESFLTIKPGFEEPRRTKQPAPKVDA